MMFSGVWKKPKQSNNKKEEVLEKMRTSSSAGSLQLFQRSVCSFNIAPPCVCQSANRRNERDKRPKECHENQELWSGKGERK